ncbi:hypothetical protein AAVH_22223 [Aphelenchoides avenae]|nr:hypothetical protein AAVH_22223 [Aphelenchus avenae]
MASGPANSWTSLCPHGWDYVPYARSCYKLLRGSKSWNDAASSCEQLFGATLVTIPDFHVDDALQRKHFFSPFRPFEVEV